MKCILLRAVPSALLDVWSRYRMSWRKGLIEHGRVVVLAVQRELAAANSQFVDVGLVVRLAGEIDVVCA